MELQEWERSFFYFERESLRNKRQGAARSPPRPCHYWSSCVSIKVLGPLGPWGVRISADPSVSIDCPFRLVQVPGPQNATR